MIVRNHPGAGEGGKNRREEGTFDVIARYTSTATTTERWVIQTDLQAQLTHERTPRGGSSNQSEELRRMKFHIHHNRHRKTLCFRLALLRVKADGSNERCA